MSSAVINSGVAPKAISSPWDWPLVGLVLALACVGLVFVYSASIPYASQKLSDGSFFLRRQQIYFLIAAVAFYAASQTPILFWKRAALPAIVLALGLLVMVLIPGIGREVNGSLRWIAFGGLRLQPSEFVKIAFVLYLALLLTRRDEHSVVPLLGPLVVLLFITLLLLAEPE